MASSPPLAALEPYIDIPFNAWLSIILILTYACALRHQRVLLLVVLSVSATILACDTTAMLGEMIKTMCLLPLGLGSVLAFVVASRHLQTRLLPAFTTYVNCAVYGNIGMMVATPAGGTVRGWCSKVACVALFAWVVQLGRRVGWKTIVLHDANLFVFTAVNKSWIFAHAMYRFILLTLPCFGSGRRHRLLELYSLSLTLALSSTTKLPFEYCFGMADTLVVPAIAGWSAMATTFSLVPRDAMKDQVLSDRIGATADVFLGAVLLGIAVFAGFRLVDMSAARAGRGNR